MPKSDHREGGKWRPEEVSSEISGQEKYKRTIFTPGPGNRMALQCDEDVDCFQSKLRRRTDPPADEFARIYLYILQCLERCQNRAF